MIEAEGLVKRGEMSREELAEFEQAANPGAGSCAMMGTANTVNMLTEAIGMTATDGALIAATYGARIALARKAGHLIMELHAKDILPRDIMTLEAFDNAIAVDMAIGGSTNTCLHLPAIAHEVGIELTMDRFAEIAERTPHLVLLKPAGKYFAQDMYQAGGIPALLNEMNEHGLAACIQPGNMAQAREWMEIGFNAISYNGDLTLYVDALTQAVEDIRKLAGGL